MKNFLLFLSIVFITSSCFAAVNTSNAGFQDTAGNNKTTVAKALKMPHNSFITLQGNIVKQISDDKYLFKDATGTLTVEIDSDKWQGQTVNTKDKIEITGELEKNFNSIKLDVNSVKKITK